LTTIACVLNPSPDFDRDYVERLRAGVQRNISTRYNFVCLSPFDPGLAGVRWIKINPRLPGWWAKIELLALPGPMLYLDLDTVVVGDLDPLVAHIAESKQAWMLRDLGGGRKLECGVMGWSFPESERFQKLHWRFFNELREFLPGVGSREQAAMRDYDDRVWANDEDWLRAQIGKYGIPVGVLQEQVAGIYSYKLDVERLGGVPDDAVLICFHGIPRPRDLAGEKKVPQWLKENWR